MKKLIESRKDIKLIDIPIQGKIVLEHLCLVNLITLIITEIEWSL
jgi:hypothetical protein